MAQRSWSARGRLRALLLSSLLCVCLLQPLTARAAAPGGVVARPRPGYPCLPVTPRLKAVQVLHTAAIYAPELVTRGPLSGSILLTAAVATELAGWRCRTATDRR